MVRFIMAGVKNELFTRKDLHSNMVRFIIRMKDIRAISYTTFTFQYG